jgi:penicillin-binding protein 1B
VAAVKVAAWAGFRRVASLWQAASGQPSAGVFPSIALGAIEATPAEVATAYAMLANDGLARPLTAVRRVIAGGYTREPRPAEPRRVAQAQSVAVVRDMMASVFDEGTARGARAAGFLHPAAGKTGTTDHLRDAWFAGFSRDLLTVVWVGRDDDRPLGFTGAQAALPIWTEFMKRALPSDPRRTGRDIADPRPPLQAASYQP